MTSVTPTNTNSPAEITLPVAVELLNEKTAPDVPVVTSRINKTVSPVAKEASRLVLAVAFRAVIAAVVTAAAVVALGAARNAVSTVSISNTALLKTY